MTQRVTRRLCAGRASSSVSVGQFEHRSRGRRERLRAARLSDEGVRRRLVDEEVTAPNQRPFEPQEAKQTSEPAVTTSGHASKRSAVQARDSGGCRHEGHGRGRSLPERLLDALTGALGIGVPVELPDQLTAVLVAEVQGDVSGTHATRFESPSSSARSASEPVRL